MGRHAWNVRVCRKLGRHGSLHVCAIFRVHVKRDNIPGRVYEAESFFVGLIEEWRERLGLEKMPPIEHSLGAYFSAVYALRHPECVQRLILLSPTGVAHDPNNTAPSRERHMIGVRCAMPLHTESACIWGYWLMLTRSPQEPRPLVLASLYLAFRIHQRCHHRVL